MKVSDRKAGARSADGRKAVTGGANITEGEVTARQAAGRQVPGKDREADATRKVWLHPIFGRSFPVSNRISSLITLMLPSRYPHVQPGCTGTRAPGPVLSMQGLSSSCCCTGLVAGHQPVLSQWLVLSQAASRTPSLLNPSHLRLGWEA
jgi:hypothetical protein